jgi:hypothetical protein
LHEVYLVIIDTNMVLQWLTAATSSHPFWRRALYLLLKLSSESRQLPKSLFIDGVDIGSSRDPVCRGGFADIFRGTFQGRTVAIKRLYLEDRPEVHYVSVIRTLHWSFTDANTSRGFTARHLSGVNSITHESCLSWALIGGRFPILSSPVW